MFSSILTASTETLSITNALICTGAALVCGLIIALVYMIHSTYTKSFVISLVLLPALIGVIIMMVNGNLGTSVAVLGAFSLVRFRSVPGSSKEITSIVFAMAVGLATGMGYVTFAGLITVLVSVVLFLLSRTPFGETRSARELRVLIPEDLDYTAVFEDIFAQYTRTHQLHKIKTTNLGSMFDLYYHITLKDPAQEKALIDALRCRNGNLTIVCNHSGSSREEL
ncbi:DUF4956 domain-containing protein [Christensenellaceae bacterium NSJ-44]|uniref:DUF4956 domain-containing protein n=1 Tax=Luoshenia tenuis TaxID=2763654 RepID=A0A926D191_9FIRM|nr:DUF4956 domain-containing protein [Luoshenia tenuis]